MTEFIRALFIFIIRLITGIKVPPVSFDLKKEQFVFYANHSSHLDTLVIWSAFEKNSRSLIRPIAAADYWGTSGLKKFISQNVLNALLIERNSAQGKKSIQMIDQMVQAIDEGSSLIIFPEGTRSSEQKIGPFKSGIYHLAKERPDIQFVPIYLNNLNRILPKGDLLFVPLIGHITFGQTIQLEEGEIKTLSSKKLENPSFPLRQTHAIRSGFKNTLRNSLFFINPIFHYWLCIFQKSK